MVNKSKKNIFLKKHLDEKEIIREEISKNELELYDKKIEHRLKILLSILIGIIGILLITSTVIETKYYMLSVLNYLQVIMAIINFIMIPLIWTVRNEE